MIRINLLGLERRPVSTGIDIGQKVTLLGSLVLLAAAVLIGWWYWSLRDEAQRLDQELAAAQQETDALRDALTQLQRVETRKAQLEQRVALIEQLRRGQSGPVHMLDEISRSLPELLWLTSLSEDAGVLTIDGMASSLTSLSDFVANLEESAYFKRPVEILNSQLDPTPEGDLIRFSIKAEFTPPGI